MVPESIRALAAQHRARFPRPAPHVDHDVQVGDVRRLECGDADARLVLVKDVLPTHVVVVLVHAYTEMITSADLVLEREGSYPLVVQNDLVSCALLEHVGLLIERLPAGWEDEAWSGADLIGPLDCRWAFKQSEGDALRALTMTTWWSLTE